ncbi:type 4 pilus major pilin [Pseudosulfitobacter pseudonitzschiae]|uniref:type 4 pilus major pilin n=1 Tax=Pseudosulfitobacter pseudonitzschiae TaxID=1402135 RepID=UPI003B7AEA35
MKSMTINHSAKKRGISLIEGVLYLVLALSVIVGGIVFFQQAQLSNNVTNTSRAMTGISSEIRGLYQNAQDFGVDATDLTEVILAAGGVPSNFVDNAGTPTDSVDDAIVTPFDGNVEIYAEDGGAGTTNAEYFVIELENLGEAECIRLATVSASGDGPLGTNIMGVGIMAGPGAVGNYDSAATVSDLATAVPAAAGAAFQFSSINQAAPGVGMNAAEATLACEEEDNVVYAVYSR